MAKYHLEVGESKIYIVSDDNVMNPEVITELNLKELKERLKHFALIPQHDLGSNYFFFPTRHMVTLDELNNVWELVKQFLDEFEDPDQTETIPLREVFLDDDEWWTEYKPLLEEDGSTVNQYWSEEELNTALHENRIWTMLSPFGEESDYYVNKYLTRFVSGMVVLHCITEKSYNPLYKIYVHIEENNE